jgi:hypothetical protein
MDLDADRLFKIQVPNHSNCTVYRITVFLIYIILDFLDYFSTRRNVFRCHNSMELMQDYSKNWDLKKFDFLEENIK